MKRIILIILSIVLPSNFVLAQNDYRQRFDAFTNAAKIKHESFRDTINTKFANSIDTEWESFSTIDGQSRISSPEYSHPPVADATYEYSNKQIKVSEVVSPLPLQWSSSISSEQGYPKDSSKYKSIEFELYNQPYKVIIPREYGTFHPNGISEHAVSEFWKSLSTYDYNIIIKECENLRLNYNFNDWMIYNWIHEIANSIYTNNIHSEREIFTVFILNQLGLMAQLGRCGNTLTCLLASLQTIYSRDYVILDTYPFYIMDKSFNTTSLPLYTYRSEFPKKLRPIDFRVIKLPIFHDQNINSYTQHSSVLRSKLKFDISDQLLRMYSSYPQLDVNIYASAAVDKQFIESLKNNFSQSLSTKSEVEAINYILKYIQLDFNYKTDINNQGYEKPYFCEENYTHQYNDCEDRVILLAQMIHHLMGLKTLILDFEDHVVLAVHTHTQIKGDYIKYKDQTYYVCDPTYIGSTMGMMIPEYRTKAAKIYPL